MRGIPHRTFPRICRPWRQGVFGYMGYDTIRLIENLPNQRPDRLGLPDGLFLRPTIIAVFDSVKDEVIIVTPVRPEPGVDARAAFARAGERVNDVISDFNRSLPHADNVDSVADMPEPKSNTPQETYFEMVRKAKEYIAAGDIFQVVLSQRFEAPFTLPAFSLYRALRRINPSPYLYFLNFENFSIVGSSPEILVRVRDNKVTIRPIAGTRHRGKSASEDVAIGEELLSDPKERAEHLMLLDLGRNDVGPASRRSAQCRRPNSSRCNIPRTSSISSPMSKGELDPHYDAIEALIAGFPAGTVSGAPKVRAMEIIDELELDKRGAYAGCVGYFSGRR